MVRPWAKPSAFVFAGLILSGLVASPRARAAGEAVQTPGSPPALPPGPASASSLAGASQVGAEPALSAGVSSSVPPAAAPGVESGPVVQPPESATPADRVSDASDAQLGRVLDVLADRSKARRIAGGISGLVVGAAAVPIGLVARYSWDDGWGTYVWLAGAFAAAGGVATLVVTPRIEALRALYQRETPGSARVRRIEDEWREAAAEERSARRSSGWFWSAIGTGLGVMGIVAMSTPVFDLSENGSRTFGVVAASSGAAAIAGGLHSLLTPGDLEEGLQTYDAARAKPQLAVVPLGTGGLGLVGTF